MLSVALFAPIILSGQRPTNQRRPWITVSPQRAASHLITTGQPKYPPFALAAGIEGTERICAEILTDGSVGLAGEISGPPSLRDAAINALSGFRYRPFTRDGKPVGAATTIAIPFKLPPGVPAHAYPIPHVTIDEFNPRHPLGKRVSFSSLSPMLKSWYRQYIADQLVYFEPAERKSKMQDALQLTEVHLVSRNGGLALYLIEYGGGGLCGATGNCPMILVTDDGSKINLAVSASGWGSVLHQRPGAPFPDVLFVSNLAAGVEVVTGYGNAGGMWGPLYSETLTGPPGFNIPSPCQ